MSNDYRRAFETHGAEFHGESGNNIYGDCPFCERPKFYLNPENGLWDCKHGDCMRRGNLYSFLVQLWEHWLEQTTVMEYRKLSKDRNIPIVTLRKFGLAWNQRTGQWLLPIWNDQQALIQLRHFYPGQPLYNTPGLSSGLFGMDVLSEPKNAKRAVWICEGEWDAIALQPTFKRAQIRDLIVAVPGASVWKPQWTQWFKNRPVILAYDADNAGKAGLDRVSVELQKVGAQISYVEWPEDVPKGFDIRDFLKVGGRYVDLMEMVRQQAYIRPSSVAGGVAEGSVDEGSQSDVARSMLGESATWKATLRTYRKWLHMSDDNVNALRMIFATVLSNRLPGDPIWLFIVAPPGGCKTELLMSLSAVEEAMIKSTLTAHSLVSGFRMPNDLDPSLIPQLNGRVFVLKDFTEILQMNRGERDEIYSILRGAYDGMVEKTFGNGITRNYTCHFSMIAGVTHHIQADRTASLGERFLLFKMEGDSPETAILAAMKNSGHENDMRKELSEAALKFLSQEIPVEAMPEVPDDMLMSFVAISQLVALLRGEVAKGIRDNILYRPHPEVGTRLAKQMKKLAVCLQLLDGGDEVSAKNYALVERVALDTCKGFEVDVFKEIGRSGPRGATLTDISDKTGIPRSTVREKLDDLVMLRVLRKKKSRGGGVGRPENRYVLSKYAQGLWERVQVVREDRRMR